ncbi:MAG TPA: hypothetical protein VEM93_00930, partial [Actinomycetota bacterium]|nr:hypothetical protein [Actinomycetota bacterium]
MSIGATLRRGSTRVGPALAALGLVVGLIAVSEPGSAARFASRAPATSGITFSSPYVVNPVHAYGEPLIKIAPDGTTHVS